MLCWSRSAHGEPLSKGRTILRSSTAHPFRVTQINFRCKVVTVPPYAAWKDVVSVSLGDRVRIRIPCRDYVGRTVYHCHVLDHEDRGMMGVLEIKAD